MEQIIAILVRNQPGVLMRVAGVFFKRGTNIKSLAVGETQTPDLSRMTVVMDGSETTAGQMVKHLQKLIDVEVVMILPKPTSVCRGMALIKVQCDDCRMEILKLAEVFRAKVVDLSASKIILEITGDEVKIETFKKVLEPYGILEMVRTGMLSLQRNDKTIYVEKNSVDEDMAVASCSEYRVQRM